MLHIQNLNQYYGESHTLWNLDIEILQIVLASAADADMVEFGGRHPVGEFRGV